MNLKTLLAEIRQKKELEFIAKLHKKYSKATIFLVGGAVRDILIQDNPKKFYVEDLDFVVEGVDKDKLEQFLNTQGRVKDVESRAFGVFVFASRHRDKKSNIDISIPRSDKWTGEGYKDVEIKTKGLKLYDDLSRRDFTINAMAINLRTAELVDEFEGQKDLSDRIIRTVGKPKDRFMEDPSRILRGIRFACQLSFEIEDSTFDAMKKLVSEIKKPLAKDKSKYRVAEEVIAKEFLRAFDKDSCQTIKLYDEIGLLAILFPEIEAMKGVKQPGNFHSEGDVYKHTLITLEKLKAAKPVISQNPIKHSINLKLGCLFHDIGKPATFTPPKDKRDRIHFNEHDEIGAKFSQRIIKRLKLTSLPKDSRLHVDKEIVVFLVKKHMILITAKPDEMKLSTFEKYFFREDDAGDELLMLSWADISATIPPSGIPDFSVYNNFVRKIEEIKKVMKARKKERTLPSPLINGHDVMKALGIKSGPEVGKNLIQIRELQIAGKIKNKKEAINYLKKSKNN